MPSPDRNSPAQNPDDDAALDGDNPAIPESEVVRDTPPTQLEEAEGLLLDQFEKRAQDNGWEIVDEDVADALSESWERAFLDELVGDRFGLNGDNPVKAVSIIAVAQDEMNFYVMASLANEEETVRYYCTGQSKPVALGPDSMCGMLLSFPKGEDFGSEPESGEDGAQFSLLVDEMSLRREAARFTNGDHTGLIGALLKEEMDLLELDIGVIKGVEMGILADSEVDEAVAFCIENTQGHQYLFEVLIPVDTGGVYSVGPTRLSDDVLIPETSFDDDLAPEAVRSMIMETLGELSLRRIDLPGVDTSELTTPLKSQIAALFSEWVPGPAYSLHIDSMHVPSQEADLFVVEVSFRTSDGDYLLPVRKGPGALRSSSGMSMFFEAKPVEKAESGVSFKFRPWFIATPPDAGLAPLVGMLLKNPQQSWLAQAIEAAIASELELPLEEARALRVERIVPISPDPIPDFGNEADPEDREPETARGLELMCYHKRGASLVGVANEKSGLLDLRGIAARFFFPELKPARSQIS